MSLLPYMRFYVSEYLADTHHLTTEQHGAYLLLLMNYWQTEKPLNNRNGRLASVARVPPEKWEILVPVLAEFFEVNGDIWTHGRVEAELEEVFARSTKASYAGKESARKRANKRLSANPAASDIPLSNAHLAIKGADSEQIALNRSRRGIMSVDSRSLDADLSGEQIERFESASEKGASQLNLNERSILVEHNSNHKDKDKDKDKDKEKEAFALFWAAYPRKGDKKRAEKAFMKAYKLIPVLLIIDGANRYFNDPNRDDAYTKLPATWLNGECWNDPLLPRIKAQGEKPFVATPTPARMTRQESEGNPDALSPEQVAEQVAIVKRSLRNSKGEGK